MFSIFLGVFLLYICFFSENNTSDSSENAVVASGGCSGNAGESYTIILFKKYISYRGEQGKLCHGVR